MKEKEREGKRERKRKREKHTTYKLPFDDLYNLQKDH